MSSSLKKVIGVLLAAFVLSVAYYGNYLPLRKSQIFINTMRNLRSAESIDELQERFSAPLTAPSPIGQEELVRNIGNVILRLVQSENNLEALSQLVSSLDVYYEPIINRGKGMSFEQNLYILGAMNEIAFVKTKQTRYFEAAKNYYSQGLSLGPKRPQFLYGMFDIHRMEGNVEASRGIAEQILSQWPDDERTRAGLVEFLDKVTEFNK